MHNIFFYMISFLRCSVYQTVDDVETLRRNPKVEVLEKTHFSISPFHDINNFSPPIIIII
jgi:hypothetical protein